MPEVINLKGDRHVVTQCGQCGVWYTVPELVYTNHHRLGGYHHCPNGHQRGWEKGAEHRENEELRRERDRLKQDAARMEEEITAEKRRADAAEKRLLQVRRRATAGVCPCCSRTFANVQRHMAVKHANIVPLAQRQLP
jgi:hypothetical protein